MYCNWVCDPLAAAAGLLGHVSECLPKSQFSDFLKYDENWKSYVTEQLVSRKQSSITTFQLKLVDNKFWLDLNNFEPVMSKKWPFC